jgi:hypothetical protein
LPLNRKAPEGAFLHHGGGQVFAMTTFSSSGFIFNRAARLTAAVLQIVTLSSSAPQLRQRQIHDLLADEIADIERQVAADRADDA